MKVSGVFLLSSLLARLLGEEFWLQGRVANNSKIRRILCHEQNY